MSNNAGSVDESAAKTNASNAASALQSYQGDEAGVMSNVNSALAAGNPFESKDYLTQQNLETSGAMNAENDAEKQALGDTVARTGTNSAALANTVASSARQGQRDLTQYNAGRDTSNENTWLQQQDKLLGDQQAGANSEAGVYGTSVSGQSSDLGSMTQADDAEQQAERGMIDAGIGAGGAVGAAFCPAAGSLFLMADNTESPVESLCVGDRIMGIDGSAQVIEEIQVGRFPVLRVETGAGHTVRNSRTHAFALPFGGFTVAIHSLGRMILTSAGPARVTCVEPDGFATVFNIITDGSHTYRADGVWALGVGEAERHVSMEAWGEINDRLSLTVQ